jgi:ribokinase
MKKLKNAPTVVVVGSANIDLFFKTETLPNPGETVAATAFNKSYGGKGANQAVTISKLGGRAVMLCRVGGEETGEELIDNFKKAGVETRYVIRDPDISSGMAFVTVDDRGENTIVIYSGANIKLSVSDIDLIVDEIRTSHIVLSQLEVPLSTVQRTAEIASDCNVPFILNPAPVPSQDISKILKCVDILCPNKAEAESLTGVKIQNMDDAKKACGSLLNTGVKTVVLTMGAAGAFVFGGDSELHIGSPTVQVRDTTGAGDAFVGAFSFSLASGKPIIDAVKFANSTAAISVTKDGTQSGLPNFNEASALYNDFYTK